jgi:hypothetical protein
MISGTLFHRNLSGAGTPRTTAPRQSRYPPAMEIRFFKLYSQLAADLLATVARL